MPTFEELQAGVDRAQRIIDFVARDLGVVPGDPGNRVLEMLVRSVMLLSAQQLDPKAVMQVAISALATALANMPDEIAAGPPMPPSRGAA